MSSRKRNTGKFCNAKESLSSLQAKRNAGRLQEKVLRRCQSWLAHMKNLTRSFYFMLHTLPRRVIKLSLSSQKIHVFVLLVSFCRTMNTTILQKCSSKTRTKLIDTTKIITGLDGDTCRGLIGVLAFRGCDFVSTFAGKGKAKALLVLRDDAEGNETFEIGWRMATSTWPLHPHRQIQLRPVFISSYWSEWYTLSSLLFKQWRDGILSATSVQRFPQKHTLHANYQAGIWKRSL